MSSSSTAAIVGRAGRRAVLALCGLLLPWTTVTDVHGAQTIKLATLAPEGSSWVKALRAIDRDVRERTGGEVEFKIYAGGVQGDEDVILRKIRVGQIHAAGFAGLGVSMVNADVLALEMPFLFNTYPEVEHVLEKTFDFYRAGYLEAGFELLGWADAGFVYLLSQQPVRGQADIEGRKVWRMQGEPITEVLFEEMGVTSVPLAIPDVLLGLQTNLVEVVYASPAAIIALQWFTRVKCFTDLPINYILGALLIETRAFERLTEEQRDIVREVAAGHLAAQRRQSQDDNRDALELFAREGLTRVTPPPAEVAVFQDYVRRSEPQLVGQAFSTEAYNMVREHLAEFRQSRSARE